MSDPLSKYASFIDMLLSKTKAGKIPWSFDGARNIISVWNGDVLLNLERGTTSNFEDLYTISLINRSGDYLESFSDETLSELEIKFGDDDFYTRMKNIYTLGMRQSTGADKALDDFMKALANDNLDEVPF